MPNFEDLTGQTFNQLTVVALVIPKTSPIKWTCLCSCGKSTIARGSSIKNGNTQSCGCFAKKQLSKRVTTHGARQSRLYARHTDMLSRCYNPSTKSYTKYGGRGIAVYPEWKKFEVFQLWALANGYTDEKTLDRKDTNGNYEPNNCRWTTQTIQVRNRNPFKNKTSKYIGVSWNTQYSKWDSTVGINYKVVHLGRYADEISAARARDDYIIQYNLEGFTLNFK